MIRMKKDQHRINRNLEQYFSAENKRHIDVVVLNSGNKLEHELKKAEICYHLQQQGRTFICEGILKNGKRPDICVLDTQTPIAYEIMCSEKEASIVNKMQTYGDIKIVCVRTGEKL